MKPLLKLTGVFPYLAVIFINAFVDLGHKITVQNTVFKIYNGQEQIILTAIINGLILLPFILLFSPAGFIADRFAKNSVIRTAAWMAVGLTLAITVCYYQGWFWAAFIMTFMLAVQSAIYSPAKYGYIKSLFGKQHLAQANGLVQAVTIIAILLGTFVFSILFETLLPVGSTNTQFVLQAIAPIGWLLVINSLVELIFAYKLPRFEPSYCENNEKSTANNERFTIVRYLTGRSAIKSIQPLIKNNTIKLAAIGLAVFWSVGQVLLATFPSFIKESMTIDNTIVIQGLLAATGIGIAIGSWLAARWSKGYIELGLIPVAAIGIAVGLLVLPTVDTITGHFINLLFIGVMGGLFIVPLNALIQFNAKSSDLGKVIAGNNLIQNISMLAFLGLTASFAFYGLSSQILLLITAFVAIAGGLYTISKLPQSLTRFVLSFIMTRRYRLHVQGLKNMPEQGGVLMLGNHISWIDWAIVQIASPRPVRFVMLKTIYQRWYLKWFLDLFGVIPIESGASSRQSLNTVAECLNNGEVVCLFPEGGISRTGHLAEFRKGFEKACKMSNDDVLILPFYMSGLWGSQFSCSSERLKSIRSSGFSRDIIMAFGEPLPKSTQADVLKRRIFDLSVVSWQEHVNSMDTLPNAWIDTVKRVGSDMAIADTLTSNPLSANQALAGSIAFSRRIKRISKENNVGLLLPTSTGGVLANMAALLGGKSVVNLNFTASEDALISALEQADIRTVYTSKRFIKKLSRKGIELDAVLEGSHVIYLEELKETISKVEMLSTWLLVKYLPAKLLKLFFSCSNSSDNTAAILFSSGSEGAPKGVMLSHRNIMANLKQTSDVLNTESQDVVMASLPLFHAFGLTVTQFMPLVEGIPMVCHADPTDAVNIAKAIAKYRATMLCGTSTFLRLYLKNRKIHPLMLNSLRTVVAGAERLTPEVRDAFQLKFNKPIFEGYGTTETTPVASVNLPDALDNNWQIQQGNKIGTVGMPLPGTSFKIVDPDSYKELPTGKEGMILIGGVQVMQGYLKNESKTSEVIREIEDMRWYVTGDKGRLDQDGFLTIVDRYSRFAKLGGEMISLSSVEQHMREAINRDDLELVAINLPDEKKGEKILALVAGIIDINAVKKGMLEAGCNPLMIPSQCIRVDELPKLGSGKTDFKQAKIIAESYEGTAL